MILHSNLRFKSGVKVNMKLGYGIFLILIFQACISEDITDVCNSEDPVKKLAWLKDITIQIQANPKYVSVVISVMEYQSETIFNIYDMISSCAYCNLRDCSGQKYTPVDLNDFVINKKNERKIWCQNQDLCVN